MRNESAGATLAALMLLGCGGTDSEVPTCAPVSWSRLQLGTAQDDVGVALGVDGACNVFVMGTTRGTLGDPASGGGSQDAFLLRLAADGRPAWTQQLGSPEDELVQDLAVSREGDAVLVGMALGALPGQTASEQGDLFAARYAADGSLRWVRQQGGPGVDYGFGVALGADGEVCLSGGSELGVGSLSARQQQRGGMEATLECVAADGSPLWREVYGTGESEWGHPLAHGKAGELFVAGATMGSMGGTHAGSTDVFLTRFDASHARTWTRQLGTPDIDGPLDIALDGRGGVFVLAVSFSDLLTGASENDGIQNAFVFKLREDGSPEWARRIGRTQDFARAGGLDVDDEGAVYVAGLTRGALEGSSLGGSDAFLAKLDAQGSLGWVRQWGSAEDDEAREVVVTPAGDVLVVGTTRGALGTGAGAGGQDVFLARFGRDGGH